MSKLKDHFFRISVFVKDKNKKSFITIIKDVLYLLYKNKHFPLYYFGRFLYRKNVSGIKYYLTMKEFYKIILSKKLNPEEIAVIIDNKLSFSIFCDNYNLPTPKLYSYNFSTSFFVNKSIVTIDTLNDLQNYFNSLFLEYKTSLIFIKPLKKYGGKGIISLRKEFLKDDIEKYGSYILNNSFIHQEFVKQHSLINKIHEKCVNTLRIETYLDKKNTSHILGTVMRFGTKDSIVDNVSSGGFFVAVKSNGTLADLGRKSMIFGGRTLTKHPDTGITFSGISIPFYKESLKLCIKLSKHFNARLIGWDIAITNNGPIIIEGNSKPGIDMGELYYGGYKKHPLFNEIMSEA